MDALKEFIETFETYTGVDERHINVMKDGDIVFIETSGGVNNKTYTHDFKRYLDLSIEKGLLLKSYSVIGDTAVFGFEKGQFHKKDLKDAFLKLISSGSNQRS